LDISTDFKKRKGISGISAKHRKGGAVDFTKRIKNGEERKERERKKKVHGVDAYFNWDCANGLPA